MGSLNPLELRGPEFLFLYAVLFGVAILAGILIPRWLRPHGRPSPVNDPEQLAYLAGGQDRFAETVIAQLLAEKKLEVSGKTLTVLPGATARTEAQRAVLALAPVTRWNAARSKLDAVGRQVDERLTGIGLLMERSTRSQMRWWQTSPYVLLLVLGAFKLETGLSRGRPVGFLVVFLLVTLVVAIIRARALQPATRAGLTELAGTRNISDRMRRAPMEAETGMAVALFGTSVLAGSQFSGFHSMRSTTSSSWSSDNDSDSGCSSDSDSSGGCGGCGGD